MQQLPVKAAVSSLVHTGVGSAGPAKARTAAEAVKTNSMTQEGTGREYACH